MSLYTKVLVPYDGSESSKNALRQTCRMDDVPKVHVVSVFPVYEGDLDLIGISNTKEMVEGPVQELLEEARSIADQFSRDVTVEARYGEPAQEIVKCAGEADADVIVMGRKGLSQIERQLIGSVTAKVVAQADRDVMVLPQDGRIEWNRVMVAVDRSEFAARAFERAVEIAKHRGSSLDVVYVIFTYGKFCGIPVEAINEIKANAESYMEELRQKAADKGIQIGTNIVEGEVYDGIVQVASEKEADLIVMGSQGKGGIKRLMLGSVTEKVIGMVGCPVLAVH